MAGRPRWQLAEEDSYALCVSQMGGAKYVDRALFAILDALSLNPFGFPDTGVSGIRLAKTRLFTLGREVVPALSLRYRIEEGSQTVVLLHLEMTMPEDLEQSDDFPWD